MILFFFVSLLSFSNVCETSVPSTTNPTIEQADRQADCSRSCQTLSDREHMTGIAAPRVGTVLTVKARPIPFSFHSVVRTNRRYGLQSRIFSTNPWGIIRQSIEDTLSGTSRDQAVASRKLKLTLCSCSCVNLGHGETNPYSLLLFESSKGRRSTKLRIEYIRAQHGLQEGIHPGGT